MYNNKNFTYATRLRDAQDILTILKSQEDYIPLRPEESVEGLETFINAIITTNTSDINLLMEKKLLVKERKEIFYKGQASVVKTIAALRASVKFQYGKDSGQSELLKEISDRLNSVRAEKEIITDPNTENDQGSSNPESKSEVVKPGDFTFAALTKAFNDYVTTVASFDGFLTSNELFKIENLTALGITLTSLNDNIENKTMLLKSNKMERKAMYGELSDRIKRIALNVRSKYGANSSIYKQIRSKKV